MTVPSEPSSDLSAADPASSREHEAPRARHSLQLGRHRITLPKSRILRVLLGAGLMLGGIFAFLPVLGLWMLPLGAAVLSIDLPPVRRGRRRVLLWWGRSGARGQADGVWLWVGRRLRKVWPKSWN
jgi:hypothetical protein